VILADCQPGDIVTLVYSGETVTVEVVNQARVRIRSTGKTQHTFFDKDGKERTVWARRPGRDVTPSMDCTLSEAIP